MSSYEKDPGKLKEKVDKEKLVNMVSKEAVICTS